MTGTGKTTKSIWATGNPLVDGVLTDLAWGGSTISYAFPSSSGSYSYGGEKNDGFARISSAQENAALFMLEKSFGSNANDGFSVEGFTNIGFSQGSSTSATIRFAQSDVPGTAYAYMPGRYAQAGDVWFGTEDDYRGPSAGNYAWHTLAHELGHALGLKHGHETDGFGALPSAYDSIEYSVMTYRAYVGSNANYYTYEAFGAPQTFMMADIAALQQMYGADYSTNSGDTIYKWSPASGRTTIDGEVAISPGANRIFATLWDGNGTDTFDLTAYRTNVKIDLRPGQSSLFDEDQLAYLGGGPNDGYARGNIFNALLHHGDTRSLIENAKGGAGNDQIIGNQATNYLRGYGGNDTLKGEAGNDVLFGGAGADTLYGGSGRDTASYGGASKGVLVNLAAPGQNTNDAAGDAFSSIENLRGTSFSDKLSGNGSANRLTGDAGNDTLYGASGADVLAGGGGADLFLFKSLSDSAAAVSGRDTILDFGGAQGDRIDLSGIDANTGATGNQAFSFVQSAAFSGTAAELRYAKGSSDTYIFGDVNGDGNGDFAIHLDDALTLQKGYFIL